MADDDPVRKPLRYQSLWFPPGFPPEGQRLVTAALMREKQAFARQRDAAFTSVTGTIELASVRPDKHLFDVWVLRNRHCVLRPFRVFAREARRLRPWEAPEMKRHGRDFLLQLAMEAEYEDRYDNFGREVGSLLNDARDDLRTEVWALFRRLPEWRYFERQVLRVAQTPAPNPAEPRQLSPEPALAEPEPQLRDTQPSDTAETAAPVASAERVQAHEPSRSDIVEALLERMSKALGCKIMRKDLWKSKGYKEATPFERWQRDDPQTSKSARRKFDPLLKIESEDDFRKFLSDDVLRELKLT